MYNWGEKSRTVTYSVAHCYLQQSAVIVWVTDIADKMNQAYTSFPGEHSVCCLRSYRQQIVPPDRGRYTCALRSRTKDSTIFALGKLSTLIS